MRIRPAGTECSSRFSICDCGGSMVYFQQTDFQGIQLSERKRKNTQLEEKPERGSYRK